MKVETEGHVTEDILELAEQFNKFFIENVSKLVGSIKRNQTVDPLSKLRKKLHGCDLNFKLKTLSGKSVLKILNSLKSKKKLWSRWNHCRGT